MTANGEPTTSGKSHPSESDAPQGFAPALHTGARDDAVALLRLVGLDSQMHRLRQSLAALLKPLERRGSDLDALAVSDQGMHAELAGALKRHEADVFAMSSDLLQQTAMMAAERDEALARVSETLRKRYEAAVGQGQQPAVVAIRDGRCPGCGETLPDSSRRLVEEDLLVVPCSVCLRLLYDRGWIDRDLMPRTVGPAPRAKP